MFGRKNRKLKTVIEYNEITIKNQKAEITSLIKRIALKDSKIKDLVNSNQSKDRFIDEQKNIIDNQFDVFENVSSINKKLQLDIKNLKTNSNNQAQLVYSVKSNMVDFGNFLFSRVNKKTSPVKFVVTDADLCNFLDKK